MGRMAAAPVVILLSAVVGAGGWWLSGAGAYSNSIWSVSPPNIILRVMLIPGFPPRIDSFPSSRLSYFFALCRHACGSLGIS